MRIVDIYAVGRERTEEEKHRRHLYGDKGAKFSQGKRLGNIVDDTNTGFKNPQRGRVYSIEGIAPAVYCYGGNLEPKIIVYE